LSAAVHPDRAFAPGQQVFDPLPLIVTQSEPPHWSAPNKLTSYESKKPSRRNLEASVRSRGRDDAKRSDRDLIEAGLN
jgi:hypothetical protein